MLALTLLCFLIHTKLINILVLFYNILFHTTLLSDIFRIFKFLLILKFTTTKLKNLEQPNFRTLTFPDKQHCVENHKHQKLLDINAYNIPINLFKTNAPTKTILLVCLNQINGFYMNQIMFKMGEFCFIFLPWKFFYCKKHLRFNVSL